MPKWLFWLFMGVGVVVIGASIFRDELMRFWFRPTPSNIQSGVSVVPNDSSQEAIVIVAQNLDIPWEIVFLPEGDLLVTQRPGTLLKISQGEKRVIDEIEGVEHVGEGGLMGLTLHPHFTENQWLYLYLTSRTGEGLTNRVERYHFDGSRLTDKQVILAGIPGAIYHDGGRVEFGPDGLLYITTGDATQEALAQDTTSLAGKILRVRDDGTVPSDNPFGNAVYSYGHRNVQGLAWDDEGRLWATEHGPSGAQTGFDELNLIERGKNYGWPVIKGEQMHEEMVAPVIQSGADETWAPAGMVFYKGSLYFAGLRGESLYEAKLDGVTVTERIAHFRGDYGRLRTVRRGPDGLFYLLTSNTDGRGEPKEGDDKIIRVQPAVFEE